jgi:uncharacterized protein (TIGR02996 family)
LSTHDSLFQAILDAPDDDAPRLVYADWLMEHGDTERGEFIRLSVLLHRRGLGNVQPGRDVDSIRQHELERQNRDRWLADLPSLEGIRWWAFRRGFATIYANGWPALKKFGPLIWAASPCEALRTPQFTPQGARQFARSPWLPKLRELGIDWVGRHFRPGFRELLRHPSLASLCVLDLKSSGIGDVGARLLAECPHLTGLEELVLECNDIGDEGAMAFARTPHFPKLKKLWLGRNLFEEDATESALKKRWGKRYR